VDVLACNSAGLGFTGKGMKWYVQLVLPDMFISLGTFELARFTGAY
jgi:hypothetical protein